MSEIVQPPSPLTRLQEWLNTHEALPQLRLIARTILARIGNDSVLKDIIGVEDGADGETCIVSYVIEVLFCHERLENCRLLLAEHLDGGNLNAFRAVVTQRVLNHCIDERRKEANSPFHFFYRAVTNSLSDDRDTTLVHRGKGTFYAVGSSSAHPILAEGRLGSDGFADWPHPGFSRAEIGKGKVQVAVSRTFWNHVITLLSQAHFLPVLDLVRYMDYAYDFSHPLQRERQTAESGEDDAGPSGTDIPGDAPHAAFSAAVISTPFAEHDLHLAELRAAADRLVRSWNPKMRVAFYLHFGERLTLVETAEQMGLSSVQYHVDKARGSLQEFLSQWRLAGVQEEEAALAEKRAVFEVIENFIYKNHPECRDKG